jgi:hypothetical protein
MYLQEILEVAIGLVFMWLVLSVASMSISEWIGNVLQTRSKTLETRVKQMLGSEQLTKQLYSHPLIANLYSPAKKPGQKARLPSYIPSGKFALALFDILSKAGLEVSPIRNMTSQVELQLATMENPDLRKLAQQDWNAVLETAKKVVASPLGETAIDSLKAQIQAYGEKYPEVQPALEDTQPQVEAYFQQFLDEQRRAASSGAESQQAMRQIRLGLLAVEGTSPSLRESVSAILRSSEAYALQGEQAIATARVNMETWFNDSMDRLSGNYKRQAQVLAFLVGFVFAVILNVDSIYVATSLWREPTLRQAIIAGASSYANQNQTVPPSTTSNSSAIMQSIPLLQQQLQVLNIPFGWSTAAMNTGGKSCSLIPFVAGTAWGIPSMDSRGLPICKGISNLPVDLTGWLGKLLGFVITAAATAQGAPFWFDLLKKMINVRSSGVNPDEKTPVG